MQGKSHAVVGFVTAAVVVSATLGHDQVLGVPFNPPFLLLTAAAGAIKADLDMSTNKGGRAGFGAVWKVIESVPILKKIFGHRGLTHTFYVPWLMFLLCQKMAEGGANTAVTIVITTFLGWAIGYTSHLIMDGFNGRGYPALYPIPWRVHVSSVSTGTYQEIIFVGATLIFLITHAYFLYTGVIL